MSSNRYLFETNQMDQIKASLLYVSTSCFGQDWNSVPHSHNFTEIIYVISGKGLFLCENHQQVLEKDDLLIIPPHTQHTESSSPQFPIEYIVLGVKELEFVLESDEQKVAPEEKRFRHYNFTTHAEEMHYLCSSLLLEAEQKKENYLALCQALLDILLIKIMRRGNLAVSISDNKKSSRECAYIKRYIDNHYAEAITLDSLAALAHMNKYYLVHAFKRENGLSPITYLIKRRILESKSLLQSTDHSLSHIAHTLGFSSQSYFSQSFRRMEGISPNQYRRQVT